ncbi:TlpA family protein disulfide reductase [Paenibacillus caseinilyticus]|uniref:Thioredoxin n=1 Tax=Paenibacillus mucilaginosus K02 TaxID=997761 RepID=I0BF65_9BACL|nr:TlpA disulfide reductase family protein [Paenibacillus mucilaginosus]AFH61012.1 thioredoxin [Paenibacillus mucilaginosus K02]AFK65369.1 thioredoxin family protein [Paenibacillus mucilaginosus K02]
MIRKYAGMLALIALLTGAALYQMKGQGQPESRPVFAAASKAGRVVPGQPVPALRLQGMRGGEFTVGGERSKPLLLNFWASWCGPCHEEAPDLQAVYAKYKDQVDFYGVNVTREDGLREAQGFVKKYGFTFPVLLDTEGTAADAYRLRFVPTSYLIDRKGNLVEVIHVLPAAQLEAKIRGLIGAQGA